jgi:peptide/nickel transport system permease protein
MRQYVIRRVLQMFPVLFGVSVLLYIMFTLAPGDMVSNMMQANPRMTVERQTQLRHLYHLDQPKIVQYGYWLNDVVHGNLGTSYKYQQPVTHVLNAYIWNSFYLGLTSFIASLIFAIPIGVLSATRQYSKFDVFWTIFAMIFISIPSFFFAMLLIKCFAIEIHLFPAAGMLTAGSNATGLSKLLDILHHMFLPFVVLTLMNVASWMRYVRTSMLEVMRQDYIRTARAKGLAEKVVIYRHALRNALMPVVTLLGLYLPVLFSGAMITESLFTWPGIGPVTLYAVNNRDYSLLMGINVFLAFLTLVGNLLADIAYALVDPRVRLK